DEVSGYLIGGFILLGAGLLLIVLSAVKDSRKGVGVGFGIVALAGVLMLVFMIGMVDDSELVDTDGDGISDVYDDDDDNDGYSDELEDLRGTDPLDQREYPTEDYMDVPNRYGFEYEADHWASDVDEDGRLDRNQDGIEEDYDTSDFDKDNDGTRDVYFQNQWWDDDDEDDGWALESSVMDIAPGINNGGRNQKDDGSSAADDFYGMGGQNEGVESRDRPRQFFPETWHWNPMVITDGSGKASISLRVPDSITTWKVDATASTMDGALGSGEASITVFKDFFIEPDIPVSVVRGDLFPLKIMAYNYDEEDRDVTITLSQPSSDWFDLVGGTYVQTVSMEAGEVASVEYTIRVNDVGEHELTVSGTNGVRTDTVIRPMRVVPDGKSVQIIENGKLSDNQTVSTTLSLDADRVENSEDIWVKLQGGIESVILDGAENYIKFVSGCGEQSMSTLSVNILAYDQAQEQDTKAEDLLEYEQMCIQGIQHELQYLMEGKNDPGRGIVWFPGDQDVHPWLTSWGLLTFQDA
ncbi:MAG: alpha-2-macroglobulin family protein, partial [Candidatus Thermoplasmatota archaeon]|nr:alpha-2-macroglobulin family protein [Candidatus Thermoplasmatota archaeon]